MNTSPDVALVQVLRETVHPLSDPDPHDALMEAIGDCRLLLLGDATHGTHEFYADRARLTQRLIDEKGFNAVAVIHRDDTSAVEPLERMALWEAGEPAETYPTGL